MTGKGRGGDFAFPSHETAEIWRLLGSLELLPPELKIEMGGILLDLLPKRKMEPLQAAMVWALGRLGCPGAALRPAQCRRGGQAAAQLGADALMAWSPGGPDSLSIGAAKPQEVSRGVTTPLVPPAPR